MVDVLKALFRSRKFLLLLLDTGISLILYFTTKYLAPNIVDDIKLVIGVMQPVFVAMIIAIAYEDGQAKRAGSFRY